MIVFVFFLWWDYYCLNWEFLVKYFKNCLVFIMWNWKRVFCILVGNCVGFLFFFDNGGEWIRIEIVGFFGVV